MIVSNWSTQRRSPVEVPQSVAVACLSVPFPLSQNLEACRWKNYKTVSLPQASPRILPPIGGIFLVNRATEVSPTWLPHRMVFNRRILLTHPPGVFPVSWPESGGGSNEFVMATHQLTRYKVGLS